jgi:xanthine dehydrogenase/oxidase
MEPEDVRKKNMYLYEDKTHFGQPINLKLHELWDQCEAQSDLRQRKKAIAEFNRENRFRKRGISMIPTKFGISFTFTPLNQGSSLVNVYTDGTVLITHGTLCSLPATSLLFATGWLNFYSSVATFFFRWC